MAFLYPAEVVLLFLLLAASAFGFWRRLGPVIRIILRSKKDPGFQIGDIARRTSVFVWEVLCQGKVIKERPLPGIAHAFVFWGFCAFALVTLNHFATGVGLPFLSRDGFFGSFYFLLAALFAVAVAVSITGLAARRFIAQPRWLGKVNPESGIIAFLILTLMLTYLADYAARPEGLAWHALWWSHTLALLGFLPLIPHTKHLHLVL
ncbi:MAG: [Fe-S]-binding protein, partial [Bryobacteraceae bacterium]